MVDRTGLISCATVLTAPFAGSNPALTAKTNCVLKSTGLQPKESAYTGFVAESLKVPADQFKAMIRALLNTPPTPASAIEGKRPRKADARRPGPKKRS